MSRVLKRFKVCSNFPPMQASTKALLKRDKSHFGFNLPALLCRNHAETRIIQKTILRGSNASPFLPILKEEKQDYHYQLVNIMLFLFIIREAVGTCSLHPTMVQRRRRTVVDAAMIIARFLVEYIQKHNYWLLVPASWFFVPFPLVYNKMTFPACKVFSSQTFLQ